MKTNYNQHFHQFVKDEILTNFKINLLQQTKETTTLFQAIDNYDFDRIKVTVEEDDNFLIIKSDNIFNGLLSINTKLNKEPLLKGYAAYVIEIQQRIDKAINERGLN
jgi:hypothetical protein